jgi:hypothetical protein
MSDYEDDEAWYDANWHRDPDDPSHELGVAGYRLDLVGGPLAGRTARLRDDHFWLWVLLAPDGKLAVRGVHSDEPVIEPEGGWILGHYEFDHANESMKWVNYAPRRDQP